MPVLLQTLKSDLLAHSAAHFSHLTFWKWQPSLFCPCPFSLFAINALSCPSALIVHEFRMGYQQNSHSTSSVETSKTLKTVEVNESPDLHWFRVVSSNCHYHMSVWNYIIMALYSRIGHTHILLLFKEIIISYWFAQYMLWSPCCATSLCRRSLYRCPPYST